MTTPSTKVPTAREAPASGCHGTRPDDPIGWCSTHGCYVDRCPRSARELAHPVFAADSTCVFGSDWGVFGDAINEHSVACDDLTAALEARDATLRSAVVKECAAIVDRDAAYNWKRAERFEEGGEDDDAETHESVAMSLDGIARDIRALAIRTGGNENE